MPDLRALDKLTAKMTPKILGHETVELVSDLGGGKTAFVRCLAKNLKSSDAVASPSFTIENIYRCPGFNIHHFDFYRLEDPGICAFELQEALSDPNKLVIVEWSQIVANLLPPQRLVIEIIFKYNQKDEDLRQFVFKTTPESEYLIADL